MAQDIVKAYEQRLQQVLEWADTTDDENFLIAAAKIYRGSHREEGIDLFRRLLRRRDNAHRGMFVSYELMTAYHAVQDRLPARLKQDVRRYLGHANFYRGDTENHYVMYYTGLYLAAQAFPDLAATQWYTGKSSAENKREAEQWLQEWMYLTTTIGQGEFDSPTYMSVFLAPMFALAQWAGDPVMRQNAKAMLIWLIADYAVEHLRGMYVGAHSRDYPEGVLKPRSSSMTAWGWLFFGQTRPVFHPTLLAAAMSNVRLPELLYNIGTDRRQPYVHTETKRVRHVIRPGLDKNPPVYKYTYMTADFALGSMQGGVLQPIQQHTWDVSFVTESPYASIFSVHPFVGEEDIGRFFPEEMKFTVEEVARFHTYYGDENKWSASSPYEQTFQHQNAIIVLYNIPEGTRFPHIDAFFPKDLQRLEFDDSGWIFCQAGRAFVAYYPLKPYQWLEEADGFRLRSRDLKNGCVVEVASEADYPDFQTFKAQIRSNNLVYDQFDKTLTLSYTPSNGNVMTFTYDGPRLLNGRPVRFEEYGLFQGPFLKAEVGKRKLEIRYKQQGIMIDFATEKQARILPIYYCEKIERDLRLSGKMDDPLWERAAEVPLMDAITGNPGRFATSVRVLYNTRYLYVGFRCEDDYVWGTVKNRNGAIYDEECVEVFLNPSGVPHQYYEINVSPLNVIFDAVVINARTPRDPEAEFIGFSAWDPPELRTSVHVDGKVNTSGAARGWTAELAIPLAALFGAPNTPPKPGDVWRINFYRIDSPRKNQREHYAWSRTDRAAFHQPWKFGYLVFE